MTYGLQITGSDANGSFIQIDTSLNLRGFVITHLGSGSQISGIGYTDYNALIFVKGTLNDLVCITQTANTTTFVYPDTDNYGNVIGTPAVVDYFVVQDVKDVSPVGSYGLQVFDSSGEVAFDSRSIIQNASFNVVSVVPPNTIDGSNSVIHGDPNKYVELSRWSYFDEGSPGENQYAGARWTSTSIRHFDLESEEYDDEGYGGGGVLYWDNYAAILVADVYS